MACQFSSLSSRRCHVDLPSKSEVDRLSFRHEALLIPTKPFHSGMNVDNITIPISTLQIFGSLSSNCGRRKRLLSNLWENTGIAFKARAICFSRTVSKTSWQMFVSLIKVAHTSVHALAAGVAGNYATVDVDQGVQRVCQVHSIHSECNNACNG